MTIKIAHISDVHFRSLKRHEEYKIVFEKLFDSLKENSVDLIFIGGDIVHSKTQGITPEIIDLLNWWFTSLASIAPTHVILGNHDGLILNKDRQDAITPIISALDNQNIKLYKKSGVYPSFKGVNGQMINWCVFSCFDEENWNKVEPVSNEINIACFHGAVWGSKTDIDWELEGEVNLNFFDRFDFGFLGDIHKLQYLDQEKRIAYPGSTVQQNYGEDIKKGYLLWEINNKNDFSSKFIAITNPHPFITIEWKGNLEETFKYCEKVKSGSRFRIKNKTNISQVEIKMLHYYLKNDKKAYEVVFQNLGSQDSIVNNIKSIENNSLDIRNKKDRKQILENFYPDVDNDTIISLDNLFAENLDKLPKDLSDKIGNKWSINSLHFSNTFSYGKNNFINFDNLNGIVGLFGSNRSGKSSIPGTLMYSFFNTTDRGSLKNIDIVNTRKGFCDAKINFTVNGNKYELFRKTEKKTNKKGVTTASTDLTLNSLSDNSLSNQTEEQRRETEKIVKKLIGTPEDFLATSFAAQGEINSFVKEKSSARKTILSKFLNIDLYEELYKLSREDYIVLKNKVKNIKEINWDSEISNYKNKIESLNNSILECKDKLSLTREKEVSLKIEKSVILKDNEDDSGYTLESIDSELSYLVNKIKHNQKENSDLELSVSSLEEKLVKINNFKQSYSLEDLVKEKEKLENLTNKLSVFNSEKSILKNDVVRHENELKILDQVPCDNKFKDCKFIKKAYDSKDKIDEVKKDLREIEVTVLEIKNVVSNLQEKEINQKIQKYNDLLLKEQKIKSDILFNNTKISHNKDQINLLREKQNNLESIKLQIKDKNTEEFLEKINNINEKLENVETLSKSIDNTISKSTHEIYEIKKTIEDLTKEKLKFFEINEKWKLYDLYSYSISKKGIPTSIINSTLPSINFEIEQILSNVVNFKIILEENSTNNLDVYIDYGDSRRIIECASGMEKMIASIAIRVALINISTLPKSDIFIIDEGFGALDSNNVEACARLLSSLKKHFKTILIISHVDEIKDIVDKNLEISASNGDAYVYAV